MAHEKLDILMSSVASSLARANQILSESDAPDIRYIITELEMSVPYKGIQREGDEVLVNLDEEGSDTISERFVRFRVLPLPDLSQPIQRPQPEAEPAVPDLKLKTLDDSLTALHTVGISADKVLVEFDPKAKEPEGTVSQYQINTFAGTNKIDKIVLKVAGKSPSEAEQEESEEKPSTKPPASRKGRTKDK